MSEIKLKDELAKYQKSMEKVYYFMLAFNLLSHVLQNSQMMLFIELLVRKIANGTLTEGQVRLIIDSMINLRGLIVIPAIYTIFAEIDKTREKLISIVFLALGWFYSFYMREWNDTLFFELAALIIASYRKDFRRILKYSIWITGIVLIFGVILSVLHIIPSHYDMVRNGRVRHAFGITSPTGFAGYVCFVLLMVAFFKDGELKWYDYTAVVVLSILNLWLTDGRVAFLCAILLLIGTLLKNIGQAKKWKLPGKMAEMIKYMLLSAYIAVGGVFMLLVVSYRPEFYERFNGMPILESFAGRLEVPHRVMQSLPFSLFGSYYTEYYQSDHSFNQVGDYTFIDSSYARMYLIYGLIGFALTMVICTLMQWRLMKKNMIYRMYILAICAVFFLVQRGIFEPDVFVFPLLITAALTPQKEKENA